jgi:uncharacterized membrane protein
MIRKAIQQLNGRWKVLAIAVAFVGLSASVALPAPSALAAATYSCGSYSSGAYSANTACGTSTSGGGVGAPNTGFAKLMEPANLAAILGSLALLIAGIIVMLKSRSRKRQNVSFTSHD